MDLEAKEAVVAFEAEIARNPYSVKIWWQYLEATKGFSRKVRNIIYERALKHLPGSYKLWHAYLVERVKHVQGRCITDPALEAVNDTFERALVFMHRMPVIWADYCTFLTDQRLLTRTRHAFDRALQSLPVTQHDRIWPLYLDFVRGSGVWQTCVRVFRRYLQYDPTGREQFVDFLASIEHWDDAAAQLAAIVNDAAFVSPRGTTRHALWMRLCDIVSSHPGAITTLRVDPLLRSGIAQFTDEVGRLWCALAEYYVRGGRWEEARDVYEEGVNTVRTVRDFATIFDAYVQFEEALLTAKMETTAAAPLAASAPRAAAAPSSSSSASSSSPAACAPAAVSSASDLEDLGSLLADASAADDVDLRVQRLELLMDRRPLLLSAVLLRQNPHNVHEWRKRAGLYATHGASAARVVETYSQAVRTVDPAHAVGKLSDLWADFAKYYEAAGDLGNARAVFHRATGPVTAAARGFKTVDDLAAVWCEWVEMEIRQGAYAEALRIAELATREPRGAARAAVAAAGLDDGSGGGGLRAKLHRNGRVWGLYLDLEESLGTVETVKAAYDRAIALKVATPAMVLNYASYLRERAYFEDAFRAYERGVAAFPWPHVKELWLAYLAEFVDRYGGAKIERARDLFEQAVEGCPPAEASPLYKLYAALEEKHGLVRHAMSIYDRATRAVDDAHRYEMFLTYIRKAEESFGAPRTREIYERAIEAVPEDQVKDMCLRYANMETKLGEVERARAIYAHAAQYCDPRVATAFWAQWQEFEATYGDEDTFKDALRVKRSVAASFSSANFMVAEMMGGAAAGGGAARPAGGAAGSAAAAPPAPPPPPPPPPAPPVAAAAALGGSSGGDGDIDIVQQSVPAAVFGKR